MASFESSFDSVIANEGGYVLTQIGGDRGGQTYAGISRKYHPQWEGWRAVDAGATPDQALVKDFYRTKFWDPINGSGIINETIAFSLFDFAVNAGVVTSIKLAQIVCGIEHDGVCGANTLRRINAAEPNAFLAFFALAKLARYRDIVAKDRAQQKFLLGWINRILKAISI